MELAEETTSAAAPPTAASSGSPTQLAEVVGPEALPQGDPHPRTPPPSILEGRCVGDVSNFGAYDSSLALAPGQEIEPKPSHEAIEVPGIQPEIEASASSSPSPTPWNSTPSIQSEKCPPSIQSQVNVRSWEPFFLRRYTLLAFFVCFTLQLAVLITLYVYSSRNNGIVPVAAKYHQAWKYGPNAILAITVALWTQVDLRAKQVTVWSEFLRDVDAKCDPQSFETDYLSKINVMALFLSLRRRHWAVSLTILGTLLLQLAAIISTSLLERVTQPVPIQTDNLKTSTVLSTQTYDRDIPYFVQADAVAFAASILRGVDFRYPFGTTESIAFETLDLPVMDGENEEYNVPGSKSYITAKVPYIKPSISCEVVFERFDFQIPLHEGLHLLKFQDNGRNMTLSANMSLVDENKSSGQYQLDMAGNLTINGPNTTLYTLDIDWPRSVTPTVPKYVDDFPNTDAVPYARDCGPDGRETIRMPRDEELLGHSCTTDRVLWMVYGYHYYVNPSAEATNATLTLLECAPDDEVGEATMRIENDVDGPPPSILGYGKPEPGVETSFDKTRLRWAVYINARSLFQTRILGNCASNFNKSALNCTQDSGTSLWDSSGSKAALEMCYSVVAVQIFSSTLFVPGSHTISGRIDRQISRLTLTTVAFWSVALVLGVLSLSCAFLFHHFGRRGIDLSLLQDPATLGMSIVILRSDPRPQTMRCAVEHVTARPGSRYSQPASRGWKWWSPWGTTSSSLSLTITVIATLIGLLELTSALSSSNTHGLVLASQDTWSYYGWTVLPSLLVSVVGLMVSSIDFNIRVMAPFLCLKAQSAQSANSMLNDNIFGILPFRVWSLVQEGALGLVTMSLGMMVMPFCLVVTGGLFVLSSRPLSDAGISILQSDGFSEGILASLNWTINYPSDLWSPDIGNFPGIEFVPLPAFASDTSAMASFQLPPNFSPTSLSDKSISLTTTITVGKLNCVAIDSQCRVTQLPSFFNLSNPISCSERSVNIPVQMFKRKGCDVPILSSPIMLTRCKDPQITSFSDIDLGKLVEYQSTHHAILVQDTKKREWVFQKVANRNTTTYSNDDDCPFLMRYGEEVFGDCEGSKMGFALCDPYLENIEADVIFSLPSFDILNVTTKTSPGGGHLSDNSPPSRADHPMRVYGMARYLETWSLGTFKINATKISPLAGDDIAPVFWSIMSESESDKPGSGQTSTSGVVSLDDLLNAPTDPGARDKIMSAVEHRWAKAMARIIRGYEKPFEEYDPPREVQAKLTDYDMRWLVQDEKSTRILQGLLAWAAFCLTTATLIFRREGRMDRVLRESPTSIGALYRLLAGSKLLMTPMIFNGVPLDKDARSNGDGRTDNQSTMGNTSGNQNRAWWRLFVSSRGAESMDKRELRRLFDVPGRVYRLKEWDVVEAGLSSKESEAARSGNDTDTPTERSQPRIRKRYGIDYEDIEEA